MVKFFAYRVRMKKMTIDEVPAKYRDAVRNFLEAWD